MKYVPKFQKCPYRSSDGKCTHKGPAPLRSKRTRLCGYKNVENCELYNDRFEVTKCCDRASNGLIEPIEDEDEL